MSYAVGVWSSRQAFDIGMIASGVYWKVESRCFKQERRSDGLSVFLFFFEKDWWITSHPNAKPVNNPWLVRGVICPGNCPMDLSKIEWRCPWWETTAQPSIFVNSIYTLHQNAIRDLQQESVTLRLQHSHELKSKDEEVARCAAELQSVTSEILSPTVKPRGYMHANPSQTKSGWFNKMVAVLGAIQTGNHARLEALVKLSLSCVFFCCFVKTMVAFSG
jgi:hypothetical protein